MSYLEDFRARTYQQQGGGLASPEADQDSGEKWRGSFVKYDPDSASWRTHQCSLAGDLEPFLETWPQWGLMRGGECWEQQTLAHHISATASGLWLPTPDTVNRDNKKVLFDKNSPSQSGRSLATYARTWPTPTESGSSERLPTPQASDYITKKTSASWKAKGGVNFSLSNPEIQAKWPTPTVCGNYNRKGASPSSGDGLATAVNKWPTPTAHNSKETNAPSEALRNEPTLASRVGGQLNPTWVEWLMGWPLGWTDLKPSAMDKSHCVQQPLGNFLQEE